MGSGAAAPQSPPLQSVGSSSDGELERARDGRASAAEHVGQGGEDSVYSGWAGIDSHCYFSHLIVLQMFSCFLVVACSTPTHLLRLIVV